MATLLPGAAAQGGDLGARLLEVLAPGQGAALWIGGLVLLVVAADHRRLLSARNVAVLALFSLAPLLVDLLRVGRLARADRPEAAWVFAGIFLLTAGAVAWSLVLVRRRTGPGLEPNLTQRGLVFLVCALFALDAAAALGKPPDDSSFLSNLGAAKWMETGTLPYGDPVLRSADSTVSGGVATYGPLLYAIHVPAQALLGAERNPPELAPMDPAYVKPPILATQLVTIFFQGVGILALVALGRALARPRIGLALAALYAGSPYILGLGGDRFGISGMAFISHVAPTATALLALAAFRRPAVAGVLLAAGAGMLYFPAFFFPAWLGFYARRRTELLHFLGGFAGAGLAIVLLVVTCTHTAEGESAMRLFLESTLERQEGGEAHQEGASTFGFWGTHPELASFWHAPLFGESSLFKPTFLFFASLCAATFFLGRRTGIAGLAALCAAVGAGIQLWKTHAAGTYVHWYYPFLLVALFAPTNGARSETDALEESS